MARCATCGEVMLTERPHSHQLIRDMGTLDELAQVYFDAVGVWPSYVGLRAVVNHMEPQPTESALPQELDDGLTLPNAASAQLDNEMGDPAE